MPEGFSPIGYTAQLLGLDSFLGGMNSMQAAVAKSQAVGPLKILDAGAELSLLNIAGGFDVLTAKAVAAGMAIQSALGGIINSVKGYIETSITAAARVDEMNQLLYLQGSMHGLTKEAIDGEVKSIKSLGIETGVAQTTIQQLMKYNISMADATKLARMAQDAATQGNVNSSEALDRMISGMVTGNSEILAGIGIRANFEAATINMTRSTGQNADKLSEATKVQARANAILEAGKDIAGSYVTAEETPAKLFLSITRQASEAQLAIGAELQGAYSGYVHTLTDLAVGFRTAVEEGGVLHPMLQKIGATLWVVADAVRSVGGNLLQSAMQGLAGFVDGFMKWARDALTWGVKVAAGFLEGFVQGAASFLEAAMSTVGGWLSHWLKPASPPAIAPWIAFAGQQTMQLWLNGFTQADFSVLDQVGASIKSVFDVLAAGGHMLGSAAAGEMIKFAQEIAQVMSGALDAAQVLSQIAAEAGTDFGPALANLVQMELNLRGLENQAYASSKALQAAQDAVAHFQPIVNAIQDKLTAAQDKESASQRILTQVTKEQAVAQERLNLAQQIEAAALQRVNTEMEAYNAAATRGAGPAALASRMNLVRTAQQQALTATNERLQQEAKVKSATDEVALRQKDVDLRQIEVQVVQLQATAIERQATQLQRVAEAANLVNEGVQRQLQIASEQEKIAQTALEQRVKLAQMQIDQAAKLREEALPATDKLQPAVSPAYQLQKDLVDLKAQIQTQLGTIFAPLMTAWNEKGGIKETLKALGISFGTFGTILGQVADKVKLILSPLAGTDEKTKTLTQNIGKAVGPVVTFLGTFTLMRTVLGGVGTVLGSIFTPLGFLITILTLVSAAWEQNWGGFRDVITDAWTKIEPTLTEFWTWLNTNIPVALKWLADQFAIIMPQVIGAVGAAVPWIIQALKDVGVWLGTNIPKALDELSKFWNNNWPAIRDTLVKEVWPAIKTAASDIYDWLYTNIPLAVATVERYFRENWPKIKQWFSDAWDKIGPGLEGMWDWLNNKLPLAYASVKAAWDKDLWPALNSAYKALSDPNTGLIPAFKSLQALIDPVGAAMSGNKVQVDGFAGAVTNAAKQILDLVANIGDLVDEISALFNFDFSGAAAARGRIEARAAAKLQAINDEAAKAWLTANQPGFTNLSAAGQASAVQTYSAGVTKAQGVNNFAGLGNQGAIDKIVKDTLSDVSRIIDSEATTARTNGLYQQMQLKDQLDANDRTHKSYVQAMTDAATSVENYNKFATLGNLQAGTKTADDFTSLVKTYNDAQQTAAAAQLDMDNTRALWQAGKLTDSAAADQITLDQQTIDGQKLISDGALAAIGQINDAQTAALTFIKQSFQAAGSAIGNFFSQTSNTDLWKIFFGNKLPTSGYTAPGSGPSTPAVNEPINVLGALLGNAPIQNAPGVISAPLVNGSRVVTNNFHNTVSDRMSAAQFQVLTERALENALA